MRLLLIRHGQSVANAENRLQGIMNSPLSELGREQAHALARRLVREGWSLSAIHTSDLSRAAETAEILGMALGAPVLLDERLREYDVGLLTGLAAADVERLHPDIWQALRQSPVWPAIPGEEGAEAFISRIASALDDVRTVNGEGQAVALVSHGRTLSMILAHLLELDPDRRTPFAFGNTSLSVVEFRPHRILLTSLNDLCHLGDGLR
ncbi:MAG: histidine phosphatase family protein [Anaerolineae bacterium]|jgi:broad specificity phosphatase PhoE